MIQRYLELLNEEQLTRVIEQPMRPGSYDNISPDRTRGRGPCLVGSAEGADAAIGRGLLFKPEVARSRDRCCIVHETRAYSVEGNYDSLCERYGTEVINDGIRLKAIAILAQRTAARTFEPEQEKVLV